MTVENGESPKKSDDKDKKETSKAKHPGKSLKRLLGYTWDHKTFLIAGLIGLVVSSLA